MLKREILPKTAELKITAEADKNLWQKSISKAFEKKAANIQIKGFRKGKVPLEKAKQYIELGSVIELATREALPTLLKEASSNIMDDDHVIDFEPFIQVIESTAETLKVNFLFPIYPEIKLSDYKNLETKFEIPVVTKEDVKGQIDRLLAARGKHIDVDRAIKNGDLINFNFKGFIDNKPFEGGEAEDFDLKIGSKSFIEGFEDQLIGLKKGESKSIDVVFPADYHIPAYASQPAVFKVKINNVKENQPAKLTNDFVAELKIDNVTTISQLESYLEDLTKREKMEIARSAFQKTAFAEILKSVEIPISNKLLDREMSRIYDSFNETLKSQGFTIDEYLKITKFTNKDIFEQVNQQATLSLQTSFVFAEIAKRESLAVLDKELDEELQRFGLITGKKADELKTNPTALQHLQMNITNRKVLDKLIEWNSNSSSKSKDKKVVKETFDKKEKKETTKTKSSIKSKK